MAKKSRSRSDVAGAVTAAWLVDFVRYDQIHVRHARIEQLIDSLPEPWRVAARALETWRNHDGRPLPHEPEIYVVQACLQWILTLDIDQAAQRKALKEVKMLLKNRRGRPGRRQKTVTEEARTRARAEYQTIRQAARDKGRPLGDIGQQREKRRIAADLGYGKAKIAELFKKPPAARTILTTEMLLRLNASLPQPS